MLKNKTILIEKLKESLSSVLPITIIVFVLCFFIVPIPNSALMAFIIGACMLVIGMGLFTLGADMSLTPIGESIGASVIKSKKLWIIVVLGFIMGAIVTISEPDLQVLATQIQEIPYTTMIYTVAIGVGLFLVIALLRIFFHINLSHILIGFYFITFILAIFVPKEFLSVAFDSGGVTTGPMTVPFIMALGVGVSSTRVDKNADNDSFGLVSLCSVGPIIAVLILGLLFKPSSSSYKPITMPDIATSTELWKTFTTALPTYFKEMGMALLPIVIFFLIYQIFKLKMKFQPLMRIVIGIIYTYLGLVLFMTGVNVGFMPVGNYLGAQLAAMPNNWIIVPIGMLIGYFIVVAEPAVHVLNNTVFEITSGAVPKKAMSISLSIGVAFSVGAAMLRIITHMPIMYILLPCYLFAAILTFFVPPIFTAIAFDSGGVASGPMTSTFLLPLALGACSAVDGNIMTDAFGIVALVAMTPLITVQLLGLYFKIKSKRSKTKQTTEKESIIEMEDK